MGISVLPDQQSSLNKKKQIENMFDEIAHRYDFLNRLMSLRVDVLWRKKVLKLLKPFQPKQILDVATGTGDLAIGLTQLSPEKVIGLDLSAQMLSHAEVKIKELRLQELIDLVKGDSEQLPFSNNHFDAVTVAFGVRNFENLEQGLKEIQRVLKPGGQFIILEFSKIKMFPFKQFFSFYFRYITPLVGKIFSRSSKAYSYLPNSVAVFPEGEEMCVILQELGFKKTKCYPLTLGIATIYHSEK